MFGMILSILFTTMLTIEGKPLLVVRYTWVWLGVLVVGDLLLFSIHLPSPLCLSWVVV